MIVREGVGSWIRDLLPGLSALAHTSAAFSYKNSLETVIIHHIKWLKK
jgi:hypothetical protein